MGRQSLALSVTRTAQPKARTVVAPVECSERQALIRKGSLSRARQQAVTKGRFSALLFQRHGMLELEFEAPSILKVDRAVRGAVPRIFCEVQDGRIGFPVAESVLLSRYIDRIKAEVQHRDRTRFTHFADKHGYSRASGDCDSSITAHHVLGKHAEHKSRREAAVQYRPQLNRY